MYSFRSKTLAGRARQPIVLRIYQGLKAKGRGYLGVVTLSSLVLKLSRSASVLTTTRSSSTPRRCGSSCARKPQTPCHIEVDSALSQVVDRRFIGHYDGLQDWFSLSYVGPPRPTFYCVNVAVLVSSKSGILYAASPLHRRHHAATSTPLSRHRHPGRCYRRWRGR